MPTSRSHRPYEPIELDRIGWKIIEELQQDARLSWAELGRRVGLTTPAVAERVLRLQELGVIRGFHANISLERLGMPILIFVRLSMTGPDSLVRAFQQQAKTCARVPSRHWLRLLHRQGLRRFGGAPRTLSRHTGTLRNHFDGHCPLVPGAAANHHGKSRRQVPQLSNRIATIEHSIELQAAEGVPRKSPHRRRRSRPVDCYQSIALNF